MKSCVAVIILLFLLAGCSLFTQYSPSCHFTYSPGTGHAPLTVSFDGTGSFDPDGYVASYRWSFGDGYSATSAKPTHTYTAPGTYTVRLRVQDDDGNSTAATGTISVIAPEYSFTDPEKPVYPRTAAAARMFVADVRPPHWTYTPFNLHVQMPDVSYAGLRGDCDDFAVMLAAYLQEHWGYDTFVAILRAESSSSREDHAVCFVRGSSVRIDQPGSFSCSYIPVIDHNGYRYYPVDWEPCPGWTWDEYDQGSLPTVDLDTEEPYTTYFPEWYDLVITDYVFFPLGR